MWFLPNGLAFLKQPAAGWAGLFLSLGFLSPGVLPASQITWASNAFANNQQSDNALLDGSYVFFLGTFAPGFVPTAANTGQWASQWSSMEATAYHPVSSRFAETTEYVTNAAPFLSGVRGYIWGTNGKCGAGEWILLTNNSWTFPVGGSGPGAPAVTWSASQASSVIVGALGAGGVHLRTASVGAATPPALRPAAWRALFFSSADLLNSAVSGWDADPDGDGGSNLFEYATGSLPKAPAAPARPVLLPAAGGFTFSLARDCRSEAVWTPEESNNPRVWAPAAADIHFEPFTTSGFRLAVPGTGQGRRFVRFRLGLPPG